MTRKGAPSHQERKKNMNKLDKERRLRILLTNGRFPVSLDLARQLNAVGHKVFVVDPMKAHVCKFSRSVDKCYVSPAPHDNGKGYVDVVRKAVKESNIQLIIPMHEEIFLLSQEPDLAEIMFSPKYWQLISLHNKWEFYGVVKDCGLGVPETFLIKDKKDLEKLDRTKSYALKPIFGRAKKGVFHVKAGEDWPEFEITPTCHYIAQEWIDGKQLCSYSVARDGELRASAVYPVIDTIDGSSCVYFTSIEHPKIKEFMEVLARKNNLTGQLAFDFIESKEGELYAIECNPRATSGIHLFKHTNWLSEAFTNLNSERHDAKEGWTRQLLPGMLMWEHKDLKAKQRAQHVKREIGTRDVTFAKSDPGPALMQPVLYISYARLCSQKKLELKELFQWDMLWEPTEHELQRAVDDKAKFTGDATPIVM